MAAPKKKFTSKVFFVARDPRNGYHPDIVQVGRKPFVQEKSEYGVPWFVGPDGNLARTEEFCVKMFRKVAGFAPRPGETFKVKIVKVGR